MLHRDTKQKKCRHGFFFVVVVVVVVGVRESVLILEERTKGAWKPEHMQTNLSKERNRGKSKRNT
jgi:hypothetical protein